MVEVELEFATEDDKYSMTDKIVDLLIVAACILELAVLCLLVSPVGEARRT